MKLVMYCVEKRRACLCLSCGSVGSICPVESSVAVSPFSNLPFCF